MVVAKQKNVISAMVIANKTMDSGKTKTMVSFPEKPKFKPGIKYVYPEYKTSWSDQWSKGDIRATKDSIFRNFTVFNSFDITTSKQGGLFKKESVLLSITNNNPHTETQQARSWVIETKPNRGFWITAGAVLGIAGTVLILK